MRYAFESDLIWENYMNPKEGGLPLQADVEPGMPFGGSPAPDENCEVTEPEAEMENGSNELEQIQAALVAIQEQSKCLLECITQDRVVPGLVQSKIALANAYITEAAQYMNSLKDSDKELTKVSIVQMVGI